MPEPVTRDLVAERLMDFPGEVYKYTGSIMQGIALGVATFAMLGLTADFPNNWHRWILLVASFSALLVSYTTWGRGVLLANSRSNVLDAVLPLGMGVCEVLLFAVLTRDNERPDLWFNWFMILGLHGLFAAMLVLNRIQNHQPQDFHSDLRNLYASFKQWLWKDVAGASFVGVTAFVAWFWVTRRVLPQDGHLAAGRWAAGLAGVYWLILTAVVFGANAQRNQIDAEVNPPKS